MCARHKQLLDIVIIDRLHTLYALASAVLAPEIIRRHALDISKMCHRDDDILIRDQILGRDVKDIALDRGSAVIPVLIGNDLDLFFNHTEEQVLIRKDRTVLLNALHQLLVLCLKLLALQTGQRAQAHINDCLCLCIT